MKTTVIGASSPATAQLLTFLAAEGSGANLVLIGRDVDAVERVLGGARTVAPGLGAGVRVAPMTALDEHLAGSDVIMIQVRIGGLAGRAGDEAFPVAFGVCGDEGHGPGGLAAAWRTWPHLEPILAAIARAAPGALVLMLTSPTSLLVRAAHLAFPACDVVGVCELPFTTLEGVAGMLGMPASQIDFDYVGVNHAGWFTRLEAGGRDLLPEVQRRLGSRAAFPSADDVARCGALPTRYLRLHYHPGEVLAEQQAAPGKRADVVAGWRDRAAAALAARDRLEIERTMAERPATWYTHSVGPLLVALEREATAALPWFLCVRNRDSVPALAGDVVLELPHRMRSGALERMPPGALPPVVAGDLAAFTRYESSAAQAIASREPSALRGALSVHPWTRDHPEIDAIARHIASQAG